MHIVKKQKRKNRVPRPYCSGEWTESRMRSFIISALRGASSKWKPKYDCIREACVGRGINPKTGRPCKLHRCSKTGKILKQGDMHADHIEEVIPEEFGDSTRFLGYNWNEVLQRMFVEKDGYQAVSKEWHKQKTLEERKRRKEK